MDRNQSPKRVETYPLLKEEYKGCGSFGKMENFTNILRNMPEKSFYKYNGMDGIINTLPMYEESLKETSYLVGVNRIKLKSHSSLCEELVTTDLENLGQFIHSMSGIIYSLKYSIWVFTIYFIIWLCLNLWLCT